MALPRDNRATIQALSANPLHGGPPASGLGTHPDNTSTQALGLPLPNFKGVEPRDELPCHISHAQLTQMLEKAFHDDSAIKSHNITEAIFLATKLQDMMTKHFYASQQPLTSQVLPDGANLRFAAEGSVESGYWETFSWYRHWMTFLHYECITPDRLERLEGLTTRVREWYAEQVSKPPTRPSEVNGLFPAAEGVREWMWAWHFWLVWQVRRNLWGESCGVELDECISLLVSLLDKEVEFENKLDEMRWVEDRPFMTPRFEGFGSKKARDRAKISANDAFGIMLVEKRWYFKTRALGQWALGRPWKRILCVCDSREMSGLYEKKVTELQHYLMRDPHGALIMEVHPVLIRQLNEREIRCPICLEQWTPGGIVLKTWCEHVVCGDCLLESWQTVFENYQGRPPPAMGDWPCPICRASAGRTRDKIDIAQTTRIGPDADESADEEDDW
ncbi:MAG: hypothetical protein M1836_007095 [Candelina mexicana]|nr:MAG: hypothetical protein M1836_007095 [Candelina mexicana]